MRQVSGPDAAFLYGETDSWQFHVSALAIVDASAVEGFGPELVRELFSRRVHLVPQLRWRLLDPTLGADRPYFVDDPDFDLGRHLHRVAVPAPGDREALGEVVGQLIGRRLDRDRPLWEAWYIEGLQGGRVGVLTKIHHSLIDGTTGSEMATILFDAERAPAAGPQPPPYVPDRRPSSLRIGVDVGRSMLGGAVRTARLGRQLVAQGLSVVPLLARSNRPVIAFQAPRSPFNGQLTAERGFAGVQLPLASVLHVKRSAGVTFNDVVLAVVAGGLRRYLLDHDERLPDRPLIAQVPVSTRDASNTHDIGTHVGSMFVSLATDVEDPVARLQAIHESADRAKQLYGRLHRHKSLNISDAVSPAMLSIAARLWTAGQLDRRAPPNFNVIVSNVAGPSVELYLAGARIEAMYPLGPLLYGGGLNISVLSSGPPDGARLHVGVQTCPHLVGDAWSIADAVVESLDELARAVGGA
jgi:WS/DGAT/MGAT family acyltransferase